MEPPAAASPGEKALDKMFDFIKTKYDQQPAWLRSVVYFLFVAFFLIGVARLIGGSYVVHGVIWDGNDYAQNCEVRLGGDYFSTNSRGEYHVVFTAGEFYGLLVKRSIDLRLVRGGRNVGQYHTKLLDLLGNEFEDITLGAATAAGKPLPVQRSFFELIPSAWAQRWPERTEPLYLGRLVPSPELHARSATLTLLAAGRTFPLLSLGGDAGKLPLRSGGVTSFGSQYFSLPATLRGTKLTLDLAASDGLFSSYRETFVFSLQAGVASIQVKGSHGSILTLCAGAPCGKKG